MADAKPCTHNELIGRVVALESGLMALRQVLDERDARYQQRANSQDNAVKAALETSEKAIIKAEAATEKRLEGLNELRDMATDQAKNFARSDQVTLLIRALEIKLDAMDDAVKAQISHGVGLKEGLGYLVGLAGMAAAAVAYFHH